MVRRYPLRHVMLYPRTSRRINIHPDITARTDVANSNAGAIFLPFTLWYINTHQPSQYQYRVLTDQTLPTSTPSPTSKSTTTTHTNHNKPTH